MGEVTFNYSGRVAVVTGGARGIGLEISDAFRRAGATVCIIDVLPNDYFQGDLSDERVLDSFCEKVINDHGKVDFLINNAGLSRGGIETCSYDDFNYVLRTMVTAPFYLTKRLSPHFAPGASVINISSTRSRMSQTNTESYTAAKGALSALTHALSVSLAGRARVNAISPGWIHLPAPAVAPPAPAGLAGGTPAATQPTAADAAACGPQAYEPTPADRQQHPSHRVGVPHDIAAAVLFLCSRDAAFINAQDVCVDGGMTKRMVYNGDEGWTYDPEAKE